ncbi:hypothetical protein [Thalassiella azotivora]
MPPPSLPAVRTAAPRLARRSRVARPVAATVALAVLLTAVVTGLLTGPPASAAGPGGRLTATSAPVPGPVVLVGVNGVRWDDVDPELTPALWSLLQEGSVGTVAVRSVRSSTCPVDGWLAVSAGRRLADDLASGACQRPVPPLTAGRLPAWRRYVTQAEEQSFDARPGLLGDALARGDVDVVAMGPGAAVATATGEGRVVGRYLPRPTSTAALAADLAGVLADAPDLLVVDAGEVRDPDDLPADDRDRLRGARPDQVARADAVVAEVLAAVGDDATVLVGSLADSGRTPHLGYLAATGPTAEGDRFSGTLLGSRSTRQDGVVQATDLTPTLVSLLGLPTPGGLVGAPVQELDATAATPQELYRKVLDLDESAAAVKRLIPPFFLGLVLAELLLYGLAALALKVQWGGPEGRRPVLRWLRRVATVFACVPAATFLANLVPWWRAESDLLAVVAVTGFWTLLIAAVAMLGPWRSRRLGPFGAVAGITAGVLAVDVATGSHLQLSSLMGQQPLVGGRFYGLGNQQFALFATGSLLLATALADAALRVDRRRAAVAIVAGIGLVAVVVDGTPGIGSDFGGPPAMVPAFAVLALLVAGVRLTWRRLLAVGAGTLLVVAALSLLDWMRPAQNRTHLGRFVDTLLEGGAWPVIERKLEQNWNILTGSEISLLVPFGAVFVGLVLMRPVAWGAPALQRTYEYAPTLRHGLVALLVMLAIGFAVNDSGTVVPAIGGVLAVPLLIAASVRTLELADAETTVTSPGPDGARGPAAPRPGAGPDPAGGASPDVTSAPRG